MSVVNLELLTKEDRADYYRLMFKKKSSYEGGIPFTIDEDDKLNKLIIKATPAGGGVSKQSKKRPTARPRRRSSKARKSRTTRRK